MRIVIIGNGIAGVTAARFIRKNSNHEIVMVSDESDEFFSRTALMYIYMGHMREVDTRPYENWFWEDEISMVCKWYFPLCTIHYCKPHKRRGKRN